MNLVCALATFLWCADRRHQPASLPAVERWRGRLVPKTMDAGKAATGGR